MGIVLKFITIFFGILFSVMWVSAKINDVVRAAVFKQGSTPQQNNAAYVVLLLAVFFVTLYYVAY